MGQTVIDPTAPAAASPNAAAETTEGYDVLMRGPLHEAFASPIPQAGEADYIELPSPPPEPIAEQPPEVQPRTSSQEAQWIPGYWGLEEESGDLCWVSGTWRFAPPGRRWLPGYWADTSGTSVWVPGSWIDAQTTTLEYLPEPPAMPESWQPASAAPAANQFWIPGQWVWQAGDYHWRSGFWSRGYDDWVWIPATYLRTPRGYLYVSGYWDYQPYYRGTVFAPISVYPSYHRSIIYRPRFAIDIGLTLAHLFVRPGYCHYYFGNYYGPTYSRLGFYPWTTYRRDFIYYDPLYVYFSLHRAGSLRNYARWYDRARDDDFYRPPREFDDDRDRDWDRDRGGRELPVRLVKPAEAVLAETGFRAERLSDTRRRQWAREVEDQTDFARRRAQLETRRVARPEINRDDARRGPGVAVRPPEDSVGTGDGGSIDLRQLGRWGAERFGRGEPRSSASGIVGRSDDSRRVRVQPLESADSSRPPIGWPERRETQRRIEMGARALGERFGGDSFAPGRTFDRPRTSVEREFGSRSGSVTRDWNFARPEPRQVAPAIRSGGLDGRSQRSFGVAPRLESQRAAPQQRSFGRSDGGSRGRSAFSGGGRWQRDGGGRGGGFLRGRRD